MVQYIQFLFGLGPWDWWLVVRLRAAVVCMLHGEWPLGVASKQSNSSWEEVSRSASRF